MLTIKLDGGPKLIERLRNKVRVAVCSHEDFLVLIPIFPVDKSGLDWIPVT
jgi:hypothetical protein